MPIVGRGPMFFRQHGNDATVKAENRLYHANQNATATATEGSYSADTLYAVPFFTGTGGPVDVLQMYLTAGAATYMNLGVYSITSESNLYPNALLFECIPQAVSGSAVYPAPVGGFLEPNTMVWLAVRWNGAPGNTKAIPAAGCLNVFGEPSTLDASFSGYCLAVASTYATTLPTTFPGSASILSPSTEHAPAIGVRFSARAPQPGAREQWKSASYWRHYSGGGITGRYFGTNINCTQRSAANDPTLDELACVPFLTTKGHGIDRIAARVVGAYGGTGVFRLGIYESTSRTNLYPSALLVDSGELAASSTGVKEATISETLAANTLYWFAWLVGTEAPNLAGEVPDALPALLGDDGTLSSVRPAHGWRVSQSYGALPDPFPDGATAWASDAIYTEPIVGVYVRLSS